MRLCDSSPTLSSARARASSERIEYNLDRRRVNVAFRDAHRQEPERHAAHAGHRCRRRVRTFKRPTDPRFAARTGPDRGRCGEHAGPVGGSGRVWASIVVQRWKGGRAGREGHDPVVGSAPYQGCRQTRDKVGLRTSRRQRKSQR